MMKGGDCKCALEEVVGRSGVRSAEVGLVVAGLVVLVAAVVAVLCGLGIACE